MRDTIAVFGSVVATIAIALPASAFGQIGAPEDRAASPPMSTEGRDGDVVVVGQRGAVVTDLTAVATFDAAATAASGATSIGELLRTIRGVTRSADGQEPVFLLNAQRVSGYQEIGNLPPEAIEKVEVLPEPVALRYGYPPTRRVVNFITKRRFAQIALKPALGGATRGGANSASAHAGLTRLRGDGRLTLTLDARRTGAIGQAQRRVSPDPNVPFDAIGNVTGVAGFGGGGAIDPALSALAGQVVTIAPVPIGAPTLAGFAAGANRPRLFDPSPLQTLAPANTTFHGEAVVGNRIGRGMAGSLTLTADHSRDATTLGPASATLFVPTGNSFSPFATDVLLQRYLVEAAPLTQRTVTTTLHAGGVVRGAWRGWKWDVTATLDTQRRSGVAENTIDVTPANVAIAAGVDPFSPLATDLVSRRLANRTRQITNGAAAKFVATSNPARLPAGDVTVTASIDADRTSSDATTRGATSYAVGLGRSRFEGAVAFDLPIASRREDVLPWAGELSANASVAVRRVGGFGTLADTTTGLNWSPVPGLQVLAQFKRSASAPTLDQLGTPQVSIPLVPLFDFATGRSTLVTLLMGGNPALARERRVVRSIGATIKPFASRELRISATYETTRIENGIQTIYAITPTTQAALPDLFVRDATGALSTVAFRPTNVFREDKRTLNLTLNANGQIGRARPPATAGGQPPARPSFYGGGGPTVQFRDRVALRPGAATIDLLAGDTLSGGIAPRVSGYAYGGINHLGNGGAFDVYCTGSGRVRGPVAASTLIFAPVCKLNVQGSLSLHHFLPRQDWTRHLGLRVEIANVADSRPGVRDATGGVPYRYQRDLLDPLGRVVTLSLRKLF